MSQKTLLLTPSSTVSQNPNHVSAELENETVIMSLDNGFYYTFDSIGQRIWELIVEPRTVTSVCETLLEEYTDVDYEQCEKDVLDLLSELVAEKMVFVEEV